MNIQAAWEYGRSQLAATSPTANLDARLLLEYLLQVSHSTLVAHPNRLLTPEQSQAYKDLLARAQAKEPVPYLVGTAAFFDLDLRVTPAVLIPRPETEQLVELVANWVNARNSINIVDVGTGSGCIAIGLARKCPTAAITAVDIDRDALEIARQNGERYASGRIHFVCGSLLAPFEEQVDCIVANLPYIADDEWTQVDDGVKLYEPEMALRGGPDGLSIIKELLHQARVQLKSTGAIFLEIGWQQGAAVQELAQAIFPDADISVLADYAGHDRFVRIQLDRLEIKPLRSEESDTQTRLLQARSAQAISETAVAIRAGQLVVFPTDTVYGIGCNAFDAEALQRLFEVKKRPLDKGIPILLADVTDLDKVAREVPAIAKQLIDRFWPGPLTLIVPKRADLPEAISENDGVAVRIPDHLATRAVIRAAGGAVAASSANQSGDPPAQTAESALAALEGLVAIVLDGGQTDLSEPSTVIDCTGETVQILRPGPIRTADIALVKPNDA